MYINISKVDFGKYYNGGSGGGGEVVDLDYMTLSALGDGEITITIPEELSSTYATYLSYSKDKSSWSVATVDNTVQTITIPVHAGEDVYLRGEALTWFDYELYAGLIIDSTANINASGNIMSLLYGDNFKDKTTFPEGSSSNFGSLFSSNLHLINAENLILPATELTDYCYYGMFLDCSSLITAPELPANVLAQCCYNEMFSGCTSLTTAPELPAATLATFCYQAMFSSCTSLTTAPALPATTLAKNCYSSMFSGCETITSAPALPATTLAENCYYNMFSACASLKTAPELPATTLANGCYYGMFFSCASLKTAPELPAATLAESCYERMFNRCYLLNNITMLATDISAFKCLNDWAYKVSATGTFTKSSEMTSLPTGVNGVPVGWTIVNYGAA